MFAWVMWFKYSFIIQILMRTSESRPMAAIRSEIIELFMAGKSQREILSDLKDELVNRQLVYRTIKRYKDTGSVLDRPRSGRSTSVSTPQLKKKIASRITRNRRRSIRKMARDFSVSHESVRKVVRNDLGLKSLKRHTVHHLTPALRQKRFQRSKKLLARLAVGAENNVLFSDEKIFTVPTTCSRPSTNLTVLSFTCMHAISVAGVLARPFESKS